MMDESFAFAGFAAATVVSLAIAASPTAAAADLVGPGCGSYAALHTAGPASMEGMSQDPVGTAAENNPDLTMFAAAFSAELNPQVYFVDVLNHGQYTVFAPTNAAFHRLPASMIEDLQTNSLVLDEILAYHVVPGRLNPDEVIGTHKTLQGRIVTVTGQGSDLRVNGAGLLCGGVPTLNATVYMIDTVLMPAS